MMPGGETKPPLNYILRIEGAGYMLASLYMFWGTGVSWWWFIGLFFLPDISLAAYLAGPAAGALAYNIAHSTIGPWLLMLIGLLADSDMLFFIALTWMAHVGFDRALGFGLKYGNDFRNTHLGWIGSRKQ